MPNEEKPPIGIMPERIWKQKRAEELTEAIARSFLPTPCLYCGSTTVPQYDIREYTSLFKAPPCSTCGKRNGIKINWTTSGHTYEFYRVGKPRKGTPMTINLSDENYTYLKARARRFSGDASAITNAALDAWREQQAHP